MPHRRSIAALAEEIELVARAHAPARARLLRVAEELRRLGSTLPALAREPPGEWQTPASVPFWRARDGLRLERVRLERSGTLRVRFASGGEYAVSLRQLGLRGRPVAAALDDLEHGIVLTFADGRTTDVASDLVLHAAEPAYDEAGPPRSPREIGARIRELRLAAGLRAIQIARAVGLARSNYSRLEAGRHEPRVQTLVRLAAALGVPLAALLEPPTSPAAP
jgi:DNA-binding XRE family transcriptional regulator